MVDVLEKGFSMLMLKSDSVRNGIHYDINEAFKTTQASISLSGLNSVSLYDLKSKFEITLPCDNIQNFEKFDASLVDEIKKKNCVSINRNK